MRRYRVSFEAELTDREVDMVADLLWDNGAGTITFTPLEWEAEVCARLVRQADEERAALEHYSRADSTRDRDALRDALQHDTQRGLKW